MSDTHVMYSNTMGFGVTVENHMCHCHSWADYLGQIKIKKKSPTCRPAPQVKTKYLEKRHLNIT